MGAGRGIYIETGLVGQRGCRAGIAPKQSNAIDALQSVVTYFGVEISFDPEKRMATLVQRGLDFEDAAEVFAGPVFEFEDDRIPYPEQRIITYGLLVDRLVAVVWTATTNGRRVISMRKANEREQAKFRSRLA